MNLEPTPSESTQGMGKKKKQGEAGEGGGGAFSFVACLMTFDNRLHISHETVEVERRGRLP